MKAMILAAGKGERMRPLTLTTPKPLLQAGGQALIDYHVDALARAGYTDLIINHAWLGEQLEAHLGDGHGRGASITWSKEDEPLETAGGIRHALDALTEQGDWFLVVNGDIWCDFPFAALAAPHNALALLVLSDNPPHNPDGDFQLLEDGKVQAGGADALTFTGISLLHRDLFSGAYGDDTRLAPLLSRAAEAGLVQGVRHDGHWFDIGTPQRLKQLDEWLTNT